MIVYALDVTFLPDDVYHQLDVLRGNGNLPVNVPWLLGLFWVRRFYEEGNGLDYSQCLGNQDNIDQVKDRVRAMWGLGNAINRDVLIKQCPVLLTANAGEDSQLTRGIKFLAKGMYAGFTEEEFQTRAEELIQRQRQEEANQQQNMRFASAQINSLRKYPTVFSDMIRALLTGQGHDWLATIANHPLRDQFARPQWGVYVNGPVANIVLLIRTSRNEITFTQNQACMTRRVQGELIVPLHDFLQEGFACDVEIATPCGTTCLPSLENIRLARFSRKRGFHSFIEPSEDDDVNLEIQAARLYAVMPLDTQESFTLGGIPVPTTYLPLRNCPNKKLAFLDLSQIDRSRPLTLHNDGGTALIRVGAAPLLYPVGTEDSFELHGDRDTWIMFGDQVSISLQGFTGDANQIVWSNTVEGQGMTAELRCDAGGFGRKKTVRVEIPGRSYAISVSILFLPREFREAMINEEKAEGHGVSWEPETEGENIRNRVENTGLCPGTLIVGNQRLFLSVPSRRVHFWNFAGVAPIGAFDHPSTFDSINQMQDLRTVLYVPKGTRQLFWCNHIQCECEGPGYSEFPFRQIAQGIEDVSPCQRNFEIRDALENSTSLFICRAHPQIRQSENGWELLLPTGFDPAGHRVAIITEGMVGGRILMDESCDQMECTPQEQLQVIKLQHPSFHPDQGVMLLLWKGKCLAENLLELIARPQWLYEPFHLQRQNPFRARASFGAEIGNNIDRVFSIPAWLHTGWVAREEFNPPDNPLSDQAFLTQIFTPQSAVDHLNQMILSGVIWFADPRWGGHQGGLVRRIHEVSDSLNLDPRHGYGITEIFFQCAVLGELAAVVNGRHPDKCWLPCSTFKFRSHDGQYETITRLDGSIIHTCAHTYEIRFDYGEKIEVLDIDRFHHSMFEWVYDSDEIDLDHAEDTCIPESWLEVGDVISGLFDAIIEDAQQLIGPCEQGHLSFVLRDICNQIRAGYGIGRRMIFQIAAVCRIRAWLPGLPPSGREKEIVSSMLREGWMNGRVQFALTVDLATIEWLIAWFREGISGSDQAINHQGLNPHLSNDQTCRIGDYLNESITLGGSVWFADPAWGGRLIHNSPALVQRLAEIAAILGPYGSRWEAATTACPLLTELAEIACGRFGHRMWIPRSWVKISANDTLQTRNADVEFHYGRKTRIRNDEDFQVPLHWCFRNNPQVPRMDFMNIMAVTIATAKLWEHDVDALISRWFGDALAASGTLIGERDQQNDVAYILLCLSSWFDFTCGENLGRPGIFRMAVLSRLRAWLDPEQAEVFLPQDGMTEFYSIIQLIWNNDANRKAFICDLATVEWSLAWLHKKS